MPVTLTSNFFFSNVATDKEFETRQQKDRGALRALANRRGFVVQDVLGGGTVYLLQCRLPFRIWDSTVLTKNYEQMWQHTYETIRTHLTVAPISEIISALGL